MKDISTQIRARSRYRLGEKPVAFFNASTRLGGVSQNAAFMFLASCALQLAGIPVAHFACRAGMRRCQLGTNPDDHLQPPPCKICIAQTEALTSNAPTHWFEFERDSALAEAIAGLSVGELAEFEYPVQVGEEGSGGQRIPLGPLTISSLRWILRIHHLEDDEHTRYLFRAYILSAYRIAQEFTAFLDSTAPQLVVVFNGIAYPEAVARWVAKTRGIRVVTQEIAHQPLTAFYSNEQVTAYQVDIPADFELSPAQNARLDEYLEQRFQGNFSMGGIRFFPEMQDLDPELLETIGKFENLVPVFTNVIFDTSQVHANKIFPHMFAWLDQIHALAQDHTETLFIIRAHPDEMRPNSRKQSRETVARWVADNAVADLPNVVFIDPLEYVSSYALIQRALFVMAYNSTIGLESVLMGVPVLNGGHARYTQYPSVYLPATPEEHRQMAENFLEADQVPLPDEFVRNARRFQYYQLFRTPIPFDDYLEPHPTRGYVILKDFSADALKPENSASMRVIVDGFLKNAPFLMPDSD